jgi:hypothetical protein
MHRAAAGGAPYFCAMPRPGRPRTLPLLLGVVGVVVLFAAWAEATRPVAGPHGRLELALYERTGGARDWIEGTFFATSTRCSGCHGHDVNGLAMVDPQGTDVNVVDDWASTMMANSARDPFFRAKLEHEGLVNPAHKEALENKCLSCHAPMGMHEERMLGHAPFTAAMLDTSALGLDGIGCLACHMQSEALSGSLFSGQLEFDSNRVYGPYPDDQIHPEIMEFFVGWRPGLGSHILNSKVCAGCHTLITETVDLDGDLTGDRFVEQATYHEWLNSVYSINGTQCTTCHMPRIEGPVILASDYSFLTGQSPFGMHHLAGGNIHMLELLKAYREPLGITATEAQFDSTIARSRRLLQHHTLDLQLSLVERTADTAFYALRLENMTGHRFPSGYPSRRAFVEFVVTDAAGDTVFKSGVLRGDLEVEGHDTPYEPHHNMINDPGQVQIYEMVMGDVNNNVTTVLERAKAPIKDNRLPPFGFTTTHAVYDTTLIAGLALTDPDFNHNTLGEEGSASDIVRYHVPVHGITDALTVMARVHYQPVPPGWNAEMFGHHGPKIDAFADMLATTDGTPILVAEATLLTTPLGMAPPLAERARLFPNPTADGWITVQLSDGGPVDAVEVHDAAGRRMNVPVERAGRGVRIRLPQTAGLYFVRLRSGNEEVLKRVVRR